LAGTVQTSQLQTLSATMRRTSVALVMTVVVGRIAVSGNKT
jgi:hypothetical protein